MQKVWTVAMLAVALMLFSPYSSSVMADIAEPLPDDTGVVGGACEYEDIAGTATIISVTEAPAEEYNCENNPVKVVFDFRPSYLLARLLYMFPDFADEGNTLTIAGGANPPASWVEAQGIVPGAKLAAVRREIVSGTCTPVIYSFPDIDMDAAVEACYPPAPAEGTDGTVEETPADEGTPADDEAQDQE